MMGIFRAYDIRGKVPEDLNPKKAERIGKAVGTYLLKKSKRDVLVGRDVRKHSKGLEKALIKGLRSTGINTYEVGEQPFGVLSFSIEKHDLDALIFITASHLSKDWNGVKLLYHKGLAPSKEEIMKIERLYEKREFTTGNGKSKKLRGEREAYIEFVKERFDLKGLKILLDCFNGSACLVAPRLFKELGADVKTLYGKVDGSFPNKDPVPSSKNLKKMKSLVKDFDLGIAYDGDGDRAVFMDKEGKILLPSQIGAFITKELGEGRIIANVGCSMILEEKFGKDRVKRIPVGHTYLAKHCKDCNAVVGLEPSSHYIIPKISPFDDGILVSIKLASLLKQKNKRLSEVWEDYPPYPKTQINFSCPDEKKFKVIKKLKTKFKKNYKNVATIDGIRVSQDRGWFLIRASNTSPKIRLYIEAKDKAKLEKMAKKLGKILRKEIEKETGTPVEIERNSD